MLIASGLEPMHWAVAGGLIGAMTLLLLVLANRRLGMSTGFETLCAFVVRAPYFRRPSLVGSTGWRLPIVVGLVLVGVLSALLGDGWEATWALGPLGDSLGLGEMGIALYMFIGGLCIGFGTRLAGGCTSGHGIFGISNLEPSGWITTITFMAAGVLTSHVVFTLVVGL